MPLSALYGSNMPYFPSVPLVVDHKLKELANEQLREFVEPCQGNRIALSLELREGEPWREICAVAESLPADLLVMGTHGRGGFERFVLGSVTEKASFISPVAILGR